MHIVTALPRQKSENPQLYPDPRSTWFEHDAQARFVLSHIGEVLDLNEAARTMIQKGHLLIDKHTQIQVPRRSAPGYKNLFEHVARNSPQRKLFRLSLNIWLAVSVSRNEDARDGSIFVIAREIVLGGAVQLNEIAEELGISDCERAVMEGVVQAVCPKDISRSLGLSIHTIRAHIRSIYAKLGVKTAAEAQFKVLQVYLLTSGIC